MKPQSLKWPARFAAWAACAAMLLAVPAATAQSDFEKGNAAFEQGRFEDAIKAYHRSIEEGVAGANVYFNLGNAYLRAGDKGFAVLNYQRALALRPGHPEASANLAFARRTLNLPAPAADGWDHLVDSLGVNAIAIAAAVGAWMLLAGLVLRWGPGRRVTAGWLLVALGAVPLVLGGFALRRQQGGVRAVERGIIVAAEGTRAHYAPADNARDVQVLPPGSEVRVLQDRGDWIYVEVANGVRGWVAAETVDTVVPRTAAVVGG